MDREFMFFMINSFYDLGMRFVPKSINNALKLLKFREFSSSHNVEIGLSIIVLQCSVSLIT